MAKTGIRHIAEKSADIIDPVQIENSKNKTNKSNVQKSEKEKIGKSKIQINETCQRLHNTSCIIAPSSRLQKCTPVSERNR